MANIRTIPAWLPNLIGCQKREPLLRRRVFADMVTVTSESHREGIHRFMGLEKRLRDLGAPPFACRGKNQRADHQKSDNNDGIEDHALLHKRGLQAIQRRLFLGELASDGFNFRLMRDRPFLFDGELLTELGVVDHL